MGGGARVGVCGFLLFFEGFFWSCFCFVWVGVLFSLWVFLVVCLVLCCLFVCFGGCLFACLLVFMALPVCILAVSVVPSQQLFGY